MYEWMCGRDELSSILHLFYISFINLRFTWQQKLYLLKTEGKRQLAAFQKWPRQTVSYMNKEERSEYNKQAKRKQLECFDQSLSSLSSVEKDLEMTPTGLLQGRLSLSAFWGR